MPHSEHSIVLNTRGFRAYLVHRWLDGRQFSFFWEVDRQDLVRNVERDATQIQPPSFLLVVLCPKEQSTVTLSIFLGLLSVSLISGKFQALLERYGIVDGLFLWNKSKGGVGDFVTEYELGYEY